MLVDIIPKEANMPIEEIFNEAMKEEIETVEEDIIINIQLIQIEGIMIEVEMIETRKMEETV